MPKKRWTTEEQRSWLEGRISDFIQAQQNSSTGVFFEETHRGWRDLWPIEEPTQRELQSAKGNQSRAVAVKRKGVENVSSLEQTLRERTLNLTF
jgi:hypothetical protein